MLHCRHEGCRQQQNGRCWYPGADWGGRPEGCARYRKKPPPTCPDCPAKDAKIEKMELALDALQGRCYGTQPTTDGSEVETCLMCARFAERGADIVHVGDCPVREAVALLERKERR